jgi:hypothetical protein
VVIFFLGFPAACWFLNHISLEPGVVEPNSNPFWAQIEILSTCSFLGYAFFVFAIFTPAATCCGGCCISLLFSLVGALLAHPLLWVYSNFTHAQGDTYRGDYFKNATLKNGTIVGSGFVQKDWPVSRTGLGVQFWSNGDKYVMHSLGIVLRKHLHHSQTCGRRESGTTTT